MVEEWGVTGITFDGKQYLANYSENNPSQNSIIKKTAVEDTFIDNSRLHELETISKLPSCQFDLKRLLRLCEELNQNFANQNYLSVAMLGRTIIHHIPPIFECSTFKEVANNYGGSGKHISFKKNMGNLANSLKHIADNHLHRQIGPYESLPTKVQVNFSSDMNVLLDELIKRLKDGR